MNYQHSAAIAPMNTPETLLKNMKKNCVKKGTMSSSTLHELNQLTKSIFLNLEPSCANSAVLGASGEVHSMKFRLLDRQLSHPFYIV